jgi:putative ABC transport system substrate-binding protein
LAKPGGNVTGNADMGADLVVKQMELLAEMTGSRGPFGYLAAQVAVRYKSDDQIITELRSFAKSHGIRLVVSSVPIAAGSGEPEFDRALAALKEAGVTGVLIDNNAAFDLGPKRVAQLLIDYELPAIMDYRDYALAGVLMTYSEPNSDPAIRIASFVDRILKGAKPGDLPVARPTRLDLVVNLTTADKLKLRVPRTLLLMANEVVN